MWHTCNSGSSYQLSSCATQPAISAPSSGGGGGSGHVLAAVGLLRVPAAQRGAQGGQLDIDNCPLVPSLVAATDWSGSLLRSSQPCLQQRLSAHPTDLHTAPQVLIIGLDRAGKTTLLERLKTLYTDVPGLEADKASSKDRVPGPAARLPRGCSGWGAVVAACGSNAECSVKAKEAGRGA